MKKIIPKITFKHWKWRKDENMKIFDNDYIVLFQDGTYKQCNRSETIHCLQSLSKPVRYIVEKRDVMYVDWDFLVEEGKEEDEVQIAKTDESEL